MGRLSEGPQSSDKGPSKRKEEAEEESQKEVRRVVREMQCSWL